MDEHKRKTALLLKVDVENVYNRITGRFKEYIATFALKRTRSHFADIFPNRYKEFKVDDLRLMGDETIIALDQFYGKIDEIFWYLNHTQDMPNTVQDKVHHWVKELDSLHQTLSLFLHAELGHKIEEEDTLHL